MNLSPLPLRTLLLVIPLLFIGSGCHPPEERLASTRRELAFEHLGALISRMTPRARVLVIGNPYTRLPDATDAIREPEAASLRGLGKGLAQDAALLGLAYPELRPEARVSPESVPIPAGASTPLSFLSAPHAWDRIREGHPEATVWVSLIGVPADLAETRAWTDPAGPRWVLFQPDLRILGSRSRLRVAFESGRLAAILFQRPGAPPEGQSLATDRQSEFDRRYLLVGAENLEAMLNAWPQLFPSNTAGP